MTTTHRRGFLATIAASVAALFTGRSKRSDDLPEWHFYVAVNTDDMDWHEFHRVEQVGPIVSPYSVARHMTFNRT